MGLGFLASNKAEKESLDKNRDSERIPALVVTRSPALLCSQETETLGAQVIASTASSASAGTKR